MKKMKDSDCLLVISALKNAIDVFFGPFLAAYFITKTVETLPQYSLHMIGLYVGNLVCTFAIFLLAKGRNRPGLFYVGVVTELLMVVLVVVLKENLIGFAILYGVVRGLSTQLYWYPFNQFNISCVDNEDRYKYETTKVILAKSVNIAIPLVFAGLITATSFVRTGAVVLVLSIALVFFGFKIQGSADHQSFSFSQALEHVRKDPKGRPTLLTYFMTGFFDTVVVNTMSTLIYMSNNSNMGLGTITASASAIFMVCQFIMFKLRPKRRLTFLWVSLLVAAATVYCIHPCLLTVVTLQVCYTVFYGFLSIERTVFTFSFFHKYRGCYSFGEMNLNAGRVVGFAITAFVATKCPENLRFVVLAMLLLLYPAFLIQHRADRLVQSEAK